MPIFCANTSISRKLGFTVIYLQVVWPFPTIEVSFYILLHLVLPSPFGPLWKSLTSELFCLQLAISSSVPLLLFSDTLAFLSVWKVDFWKMMKIIIAWTSYSKLETALFRAWLNLSSFVDLCFIEIRTW